VTPNTLPALTDHPPWWRHCSDDPTPSEVIATAREQEELTLKLAAQSIGAGKTRGSLATCELAGQWCSGRTPARQLIIGSIPGGAKASTNTGGSRLVYELKESN
jgi:hypothetical protein